MDPYISRIRSAASDIIALKELNDEIRGYYNNQILIAAANAKNWEGVYKLIQDYNSNRWENTKHTYTLNYFKMLLTESNIYNNLFTGLGDDHIINYILINIIIALIDDKHYSKVSELVNNIFINDQTLLQIISYLINNKQVSDARFIFDLSGLPNLDVYYTSDRDDTIYHAFEHMNKEGFPAEPINFVIDHLSDVAKGNIFIALHHYASSDPVLTRLIKKLSKVDLIRYLDYLMDKGITFTWHNELIDFMLQTNNITREDKIRLIDRLYRDYRVDWPKIFKYIYLSDNKSSLLQKFPPPYHEVREKLSLWVEARNKFDKSLSDTDINEFINTLEQEYQKELEEKYRAGGTGATENIIALYHQQGLIEEQKQGPPFLFPKGIKPETITSLLNEVDLPMNQSPNFIRVSNYLISKGISFSQKGKEDDENHLWLDLTGEYIYEFTIDGKKVRYLIRPGTILAVPKYEELTIIPLKEGVVAGLY